MNTDFRISVGYFEHPKIMKLERRLGEVAVLAHIRLLRFASMNKPDGILNEMDAEEIADAAKYKGDAETFLSTLVSVRLLDQDEAGGLTLHDWATWNPWAAGHAARSDKAKAAATARWRPSSSDTATSMEDTATSIIEQCSEHSQAMPLSISESFPSPEEKEFLLESAEPIASEEEQEAVQEAVQEAQTVKPPEKSPAAAPRSALLLRFDCWYKAYPRKRSPGEAEKVWLRIKPDSAMLQEMLAALEWQKTSRDWLREGGQFVPYPASYLNNKGWLDEPEAGSPGQIPAPPPPVRLYDPAKDPKFTQRSAA